MIFVTGKGGVGKSTVAAALAVAGADTGRRTILVAIDGGERHARLFGRKGLTAEETRLEPGLWGVEIDPPEALREWFTRQLGSQTLSRLVTGSGSVQHLVAAAPGAKELVALAKAWEIAQLERWDRSRSAYDLAIIDGPATGHAVGMLQTPRTYAEIARVGSIRRQADKIDEFLADPERAAIVAVALPEEMPVNETLDLERRLHDQLGLELALAVVNQVRPDRFDGADAKALAAALADGGVDAGGREAVGAALSAHARARGERSQIRRLRSQITAPVTTLPFVPGAGTEREALGHLAAELAKRPATHGCAPSSARPSSRERTGR
jgi:anion-transporting  ArsA/GET3 family ATPase